MAIEVASRETVALAQDEFADLHREVSDWTVVSIGGVQRLQRKFELPDFATTPRPFPTDPSVAAPPCTP